MWFQILRARLGTSRKKTGVEQSFEPFPVPQNREEPLLALFRAAPVNSESTFVNQLSILFQECGLGFYWCGAEHHGTPQNACYSTLNIYRNRSIYYQVIYYHKKNECGYAVAIVEISTVGVVPLNVSGFVRLVLKGLS